MSIQRIERLGVILALVLAFVAMPAAAQMKVGYVDTQYILTKYQRALDVQKQLENEGNAMAAELKTLEDEITSKQERLQQQSLLLSDEKKREQYAEIQQMIQNYQLQTQNKQQQYQKREIDLMGPVYQEIDTAIKAVGDTEGFDFVMKAEALLFAKESLNLTEKVLDHLAKNAGKAQ